MIAGTPGFRFHEGTAPFGTLDVLTPHAGNVSYRNIPPLLAVQCGPIAQEAWADSDWLRASIGQQACDTLRTDDNAPFGKAAGRDAVTSFYAADHYLAAALKPSPRDPRDFSMLVGYGTGKLDVSGNVLERKYKQLFRPDKVYGKVSNVNVLPEYQRHKIGVALLHALLTQMPEEAPATVYVTRGNARLIEKLGRLGYSETGSQLRIDLIPNVTIDEVRLQADSIGEVDKKLVRANRWLNDAEIIR